MMRPSVQGVDPPVCCTPGCYCYICKRQLCGFPQCAASWMTYARDSFVDSQGGLLSSRGGGPDTLAQTHWHQSYTPQVGSDDLEPLALRESGGGSVRQEREHALPVVLHSPLTSRIRVERASVILIAPNQPGFPDLTELLEAPPCKKKKKNDTWREVYAIPGGGLGVAFEPGTMEPSCVIASGVSEEMGALQSRTLMGARKLSTRRLYASKWECLRKSQAHIDPTTCTISYVLSFPAAQNG